MVSWVGDYPLDVGHRRVWERIGRVAVPRRLSLYIPLERDRDDNHMPANQKCSTPEGGYKFSRAGCYG